MTYTIATIILLGLVGIFEMRYSKSNKRALDAAHEMKRQTAVMTRVICHKARRPV